MPEPWFVRWDFELAAHSLMGVWERPDTGPQSVLQTQLEKKGGKEEVLVHKPAAGVRHGIRALILHL